MRDSGSGFFSGGFAPSKPPRARSLSEARAFSKSGSVFAVRPGGAKVSVFQGAASHVATTSGTVWNQQYAKSDAAGSTRYGAVFAAIDVTDLTRANKALVAGHSDTLSPPKDQNTWRGKAYRDQGLVGASLIRINEATTAFGAESMGSVTRDAGTGIMAEALRRKWKARSAGGAIGDMPALLGKLTTKYPQLDTVAKMRTAGEASLEAQIARSRFKAAVAAGARGLDKKVPDLNAYVQRKFDKHGLGTVPGGWGEALKAKRRG